MNKNAATDEYFINETLKLAKQGLGWTSPNPMVGAIIVKSGKIIGKGYHRRVGSPHAEVKAINAAKQTVKGATLYVNLEPCTHYGRTPPCSDAIIRSGIKRIVYATKDPNPKVSGKSEALYKKTGIAVKEGTLESKARILNEAFFAFHEKKRPFIAIKFASSLDGKIATRTGDSQWITTQKSRQHARNLRALYHAVCVGSQTVMKDNPHLGVRQKGKRDPLRIILDQTLATPLASQVFRDSNVLIVTTNRADLEKKKTLIRRGVKFIVFDKEISLPSLMKELYQREIISLLVEGGGKTLGSFVDERLVDKVYAFFAPILIGGEKAIGNVLGIGAEKVSAALPLRDTKHYTIDTDHLIVGYVKNDIIRHTA
ncbi:MAG: bifunctional diaminohydroxyphosphoribosylaminopyrimidine deaminase/5-amino-6-(5-phosphoribosylamino)uracil reductase RibD [Candidatus Levybacteria bacterium]|nr:bifunctional diaminohydroxyphosphoribosylaminopyrimidine deaminase/5-amino-6-(5-phosphoribosylamino)uracil reductase RibD [Candidatus Levybacteria bacterium]